MFAATLHSLLLICLCALTWALNAHWQAKGTIPAGQAVSLYLLFVVEYLFILHSLARTDEKRPIIVLITASIIGRVILAFTPVLFTGDLPRYLWEGLLVREGINPFYYPPEHAALEHLRTPYWADIEYPHLSAIYPPVAQYFLALFAHSVLTWKLFLVVVESFNIYLLSRLLKDFSIPRGMVLVYACLPLTLLEIGLSGHLEALVITFLLSFFVYVRSLELRAFFVYHDTIKVHCMLALAVIAAAGILTKYVLALPLAVFLVVRGKHFGTKRLAFFLLSFTFLIFIFSAPFLKVDGKLIPVFSSLGTYLRHWQFNDSLLHLFGDIASVDWRHLESFWHLKAILAAIWATSMFVLLKSARNAIWPTTAGFAIFLICSAVVHPWYALWFAPLLAVEFSPALLYFLLALPLAYAPHITGTAADVPIIIKYLEYLPILLIGLYSQYSTALPVQKRFTGR
jgi:hypothetical protein